MTWEDEETESETRGAEQNEKTTRNEDEKE